jgi:hypothetical protein
VRTAYWRAASAEKIEKDLRETIHLAESALADSRKIEQERIRDPLEALRYQRTVKTCASSRASSRTRAAKIELAALINLPPGTQFQLALATELKPAALPLPIEQMEDIAIARNADLREQFYNVRIAVAETKKSMMRMFPGISFNYSLRHDTNSYLIHNSWQEAGAQISWNLFTCCPRLRRQVQRINEKLAEQRHGQMAVLAQVHLARQQYENAYKLLDAPTPSTPSTSASSSTARAARTPPPRPPRPDLQQHLGHRQPAAPLPGPQPALRRQQPHQSTLGLEPEIASLNDTSLSDLRRNVEGAMEQWNRGDALKARRGAGAEGRCRLRSGTHHGRRWRRRLRRAGRRRQRHAALRGRTSPPTGHRRTQVSNAAWSIADIHERSMAR